MTKVDQPPRRPRRRSLRASALLKPKFYRENLTASRSVFSYTTNFVFQFRLSADCRRARLFPPMIVEWMLSPRLCSPQRRPVIKGDSIFPVHPLDYRLNSHYYKVTNEPSKCPADHLISLFPFFASVLFLKSLLPFPRRLLYFIPILSVSLSGKRTKSILFTTRNRKLKIEALELRSSDDFEIST